MYESFFGLSRRPFAAVPQVDLYFPARNTDAARAAVVRCVERAEGGAIIAGPAGTGKSLLCRVLAEQFRERFDIVYLANGRLATRRALLQAMLFELDMPYRGMEEGELRLSLLDRLSPSASARQGMLLLIDEAHLLPLRLLEEVRMITDLVRNGESRVRLVLAGAPMLEERLATPRLYALQQRITTRCYLEAFNRAETADYVRHQIVAVGGRIDDVFTPAALEAVYRATEGIPRLVNQTCDHALVLAEAGGVRPIDAAGIEEAWADLQQLPTPWSRQSGFAPPIAENSEASIEFGALSDAPAAEFEPLSDAVRLGSIDPTEREDALSAVIPVESSAAVVEPNEHVRNADGVLDALETHLAEWEADYEPPQTKQPEMELIVGNLRRDPFVEEFVEEVVVIDRYGRCDAASSKPQPVASDEGRWIAAMLGMDGGVEPMPILRVGAGSATETERPRPNVALPAKTAPCAALETPRSTASWDPVEPDDFIVVPRCPPSDADMIIVEDEPHVGAAGDVAIKPVRKQDFRQMFARLRRGS